MVSNWRFATNEELDGTPELASSWSLHFFNDHVNKEMKRRTLRKKLEIRKMTEIMLHPYRKRKYRARVNFTNILRAAFSYDSFMWSFFVYRWTSLSAVFLSVNFLIHIGNIGIKCKISSQNPSFYLQIQYSRSKIAGRITANNEAHLYLQFSFFWRKNIWILTSF